MPMIKKVILKAIILLCSAISLIFASLYLYKNDGATLSAIGLGLISIMCYVKVYLYSLEYKKYCKICDKLWYLKDRVNFKAKKLYELKAVNLYIKYSSEEDLQVFLTKFEGISEDDPFYGEFCYVVEQIKSKLNR